jgi:AraC family transcriptional regulator
MEWMKLFDKAIDYIEKNITGDISADDIAKKINVSASYFQRAFQILSGFTIGGIHKIKKAISCGYCNSFGEYFRDGGGFQIWLRNG